MIRPFEEGQFHKEDGRDQSMAVRTSRGRTECLLIFSNLIMDDVPTILQKRPKFVLNNFYVIGSLVK